MNRTEKAQVVEELREAFANAKSIILASHTGIDVNTINELRSSFRQEQVEYRVVKNTLAKLAIAGTDMEPLGEYFVGPTAVAYSFEDAISPARIAKQFAKDHDKYEIRAGYVDGSVFGAEGVVALAEMPTKPELQAKLLGLLQAVPSKFLRTLNAAPQQFLLVLKARQDAIAA